MTIIAIAAIAIFLMIALHELGHYLTARMLSIPVKRISLGAGPLLASFRCGGTPLDLHLLPIRGFVLVSQPGTHNQTTMFHLKRICFSLGGAVANIICCVALYILLAAYSGETTISSLLFQPIWDVGALIFNSTSAIFHVFTNPVGLLDNVAAVSPGGHGFAELLRYAVDLAVYYGIHLAILNILPLPRLDGGLLMYHLLAGLGTYLKSSPLSGVILRLKPVMGFWLAVLVVNLAGF